MADAPTFTFEQRVAGANALATALQAESIKTEPVHAEKGKVELFDSIFVRVLDKAGVPAGDLSISGTGYINVKAFYTKGDQKVFARAIDVATEEQGAEVKSGKFTKTKPSPGGASFLGKLG